LGDGKAPLVELAPAQSKALMGELEARGFEMRGLWRPRGDHLIVPSGRGSVASRINHVAITSDQ